MNMIVQLAWIVKDVLQKGTTLFQLDRLIIGYYVLVEELMKGSSSGTPFLCIIHETEIPLINGHPGAKVNTNVSQVTRN